MQIRRSRRNRLAWAWGLILLAPAGSVFGGNIVITGHDDEVHAGGCGYATQASDQLRAMVTFARSGAPNSLLPVLSFDHGEKLKACLTATDIFIFHRSSPAP
jgi:hypothetical protein